MNGRIQRHADRLSVSFCEDSPEVMWIVTVTFDNKAVEGLSDDSIIAKARERLCAVAAA